MPEPVGTIPTFVGREQELGELLESLEGAASGNGRVVLIAGEPGVGKSRLADEIARSARQSALPVLWGRGWEDSGAPPYWPWIQALRAHLRATGADDLRHQLGSGAEDLVQMLPELRGVLPDIPLASTRESESARFQLFDSTTGFIRRAAEATPMLVVLDDLHAADTASLLLLRFLAGQIADMRLLLIGTYRDVELTPDHPLAVTLPELAREPTTRIVTLGGLQPSAVGAFIRATAGLVPHDLVVSAVWRETNGNPLFVSEAVRLLSAEGRLADVTDLPSMRVAVPAGVRDVISRRISHLGEAASEALALGAVLGPEFRLEVLRRVADLGVDETRDRLDEASRAGLLQPVAGALERFRFSHDLVRETLYDSMPAGERVRLHRRIMEVIEALAGDAPDEHLAELAFHAFEAIREGDSPDASADTPASGADKAIDYARRAGEQASRSVAYEEAARLYRMALSVMELHRPLDHAAKAEVLLALGDAMARAGDLSASRATFLEAAAIARRTGKASQLALAALGVGGRLPWARPGRDTRLVPLLQDALVLLGGADGRLRVRLLTRLACAWRSSPEHRDQCATLSEQAVDLARRLGDPATLSYALAGRYWATWWPENPDGRLILAEEMLAVARDLGDPERLIDAELMLFMTYTELARMGDARRKLHDVRRLAEELRQPAQLWLGVAPRTMMALVEGDFPLAEELLARELLPSTPITPASDEASAASFHLYLLRREQGRAAEAEPVVRLAVERFPWYPLHRGALACLLVDLDRVDEARSVFEDLARNEFAALYPDCEWMLGMCVTAEACWLLQDASAAAVLYEKLAPFAGRHAIGQAEGSVGAVDRYLGLLAATMGREDDAEGHLGEAVRHNRAMGASPWEAHSQHDLALLLQRRGGSERSRRAAGLMRQALSSARRMRMSALVERIGGVPGDDGTEAPVPAVGSAVFHNEGEYWSVGMGDGTVRIRDSKGMRYLAILLAHPGRELHSTELARMISAAGVSAGEAPRAVAPGEADSHAFSDIGAMLDPQAKAAYRARLEELEGELAEADSWNDPERAARARAEREVLVSELSRAVGLGGRDRKAASTAERARVSVTRAVRNAIERIASQSPEIGGHLGATIRTGAFCVYMPDPRVETRWRI